MMKEKYFQLYDQDNQEWGILYSEDSALTVDVIEEQLKLYIKGEIPEHYEFVKLNPDYEEDCGTDGFEEYLQSLGYIVERIFLEEVFCND